MNTNVWIPQNFNYNGTLKSLRFREFFSSFKGSLFDVKLVAAKVIRQHMIFLDKNLWNDKRIW